jgi:cytochrome c oxidase cbb3-type subunit III
MSVLFMATAVGAWRESEGEHGRHVALVGRVGIVALVSLVYALCVGLCLVTCAAGQESPPPSTTVAQAGPGAAGTAATDVASGKRAFDENCTSCHGVDASGGDGPDLRGVPDELGDVQMAQIVRRGIPGTAMPNFYLNITEKDAANIVAYIRTLKPATTAAEAVTGDPAKGQALYNSSGCPACHMIAGQGGSIGPELTRIGMMRGAPYLRNALEHPGTDLPKVSEGAFTGRWTQYLMFRAVEKDGRVVEGMRVGEDSFTIVLRDASGKFHGLWKPDLRSLEKEPGKSFMPSYKDTLSEGQMDDVLAYLASLKGAQ